MKLATIPPKPGIVVEQPETRSAVKHIACVVAAPFVALFVALLNVVALPFKATGYVLRFVVRQAIGAYQAMVRVVKALRPSNLANAVYEKIADVVYDLTGLIPGIKGYRAKIYQLTTDLVNSGLRNHALYKRNLELEQQKAKLHDNYVTLLHKYRTVQEQYTRAVIRDEV